MPVYRRMYQFNITIHIFFLFALQKQKYVYILNFVHVIREHKSEVKANRPV